jgi:hypothetical protein
LDPIARVVLVTISMANGIDATSRTTVNDNDSFKGIPSTIRYMKLIRHRVTLNATRIIIILISTVERGEIKKKYAS